MPGQAIAIIPAPSSLTPADGHFILQPGAAIACHGPGAAEVGQLLAEYLRPATDYLLPVRTDAAAGAAITLTADGEGVPDDAGFVDERYQLTVSPDAVAIRAANATGLARGIQALRQLLPSRIYQAEPASGPWTIPCVQIDDAPRFRWRGQHLDVSRHFLSADDVCRFIELLAQHRLNVCHLHLTDDQGWRVEIRKYPQLTAVGSRRDCTLIGHERDRPRRYDSQPYGGYYTQDDLRRIVAFAARRHITLVPEIDMPGHMVAAITAYPWLGNVERPSRVRCHWGISQQVLNVEERTVAFMQDVLTEVMAIFPGRFIHVGGDEAPKHEWSESPRAQERMAELGLHSEDELQSWFIRRMDAHIQAAGRRLIGWDEILEGGLADGATVMSWRGESAAVEAAAEGHDVVLSPNQDTYLDHYQAEPTEAEPLAIGGLTTTADIYAYEPIPAAMPAADHPRVLGSQCQLWTEYMPGFDHVLYMGFPRICAMSEVLWLQPAARDYADFLTRLAVHRERLEIQQVKAHPQP